MVSIEKETLLPQCAVLIFTPATPDTEQPGPAEGDVHGAYANELIESGAMVAAFALHPAASATSIRRDGQSDGPFFDAPEVVAGFYVIEASDLDAAWQIAGRNPILEQGGGVEVRPVEGGFIVGRAPES